MSGSSKDFNEQRGSMIDAGRANSLAELKALARVRGYSDPEKWAWRIQSDRERFGDRALGVRVPSATAASMPDFYDRRAANLCIDFVRPLVSHDMDAAHLSERDELVAALKVVAGFVIGDQARPLNSDAVGVARLRLKLLRIELDRGGYLVGLDNCVDRLDLLVRGLTEATNATAAICAVTLSFFAGEGLREASASRAGAAQGSH